MLRDRKGRKVEEEKKERRKAMMPRIVRKMLPEDSRISQKDRPQ
jgi:hypothetical protein